MLNQQQIKNQFESLTTLQAIQNQAYEMLVQGLAKTDFSMREWGILVYLEQHGQATASELADAFTVTRTLISRNTWRLIQDNLIQSHLLLVLWNQKDHNLFPLSSYYLPNWLFLIAIASSKVSLKTPLGQSLTDPFGVISIFLSLLAVSSFSKST